MLNPKSSLFSLTEAAAARARQIIEAADPPAFGIKVGVKNGGCAGMSYSLDLAEAAGPGDEIIEDRGVKILIAPKDLMFLIGAELDYESTRLSAAFSFRNPNQTGACGCGESVSIKPASERV